MPTNYEKISYIIDNNIKYKLKHRNLPRIKKSQCSYFLNSGQINIDLFFDPMYQYYLILCVLNGTKRIEEINIFNFDNDQHIEYNILLKYYKILLISSKLKLNIIYTDKIDHNTKKSSFKGIVFNSKNKQIGIIYYICTKYRNKKNKRYLFTNLELDIIKEYLNNGTNTINYINMNNILKKTPNKLKHIFKDIKDTKSHKKNYINHIKIINKNKNIMNEYYQELINNTKKKFKNFINTGSFRTMYKKYENKVKILDITKKVIFTELIHHDHMIKNKISNELNKIK